MEFKVVNSSGDTITSDGTAQGAMGGTEMMKKGLVERLDPNLLNDFNIICSRVRELSEDKQNILWLHDLWNDPENAHLKEKESLERFAKLVFVSYTQAQAYQLAYGIPHSKSIVLRNAIVPIEEHEKSRDGQVCLIYHTTPHRGLEILVPVFEFLYAKYGDSIHLDVYSSFDIYGWPQRNEPYEQLFQRCRDCAGITYHGSVSNDEVREALKKAHIFAYPSIWPETSCIAAMEAMSAGCAVVHPNYGALPETLANWGVHYQYHEDPELHAGRFAAVLDRVIFEFWNENHQNKLEFQKIYADAFYSWENRIPEWQSLLLSLKQQNNG